MRISLLTRIRGGYRVGCASRLSASCSRNAIRAVASGISGDMLFSFLPALNPFTTFPAFQEIFSADDFLVATGSIKVRPSLTRSLPSFGMRPSPCGWSSTSQTKFWCQWRRWWSPLRIRSPASEACKQKKVDTTSQSVSVGPKYLVVLEIECYLMQYPILEILLMSVLSGFWKIYTSTIFVSFWADVQVLWYYCYSNFSLPGRHLCLAILS